MADLRHRANVGRDLQRSVYADDRLFPFKEKAILVGERFRLYGQVFFYSVACGLVSVLIGTRQFGWGLLAKMVLSFSFNRYWYFSAYLVIYMLHPFLNKLINTLNRKQLLALCVVCLTIFSGIRTLTAAEWLQGTNRMFIFVTRYFVGAYIRTAEIRLKKKGSV